MANSKLFEKDLRDYLTEASDYDIRRIMQIYERYSPDPIVSLEKVYVTKIEKVYIQKQMSARDMKSLAKGKTPYPQITNLDIVDICCKVFGVERERIFQKNRRGRVPICRQCISYFLYRYTHLSLKEVGKYLNGRDHTTIMYAVGIIKDVIEKEQLYAYESVMLVQEELYKLIKRRKNAKRNIERTSEGNTPDLQRQGVLRQAI